MSKPTFKDWLEGARLRTLPAAAAPVFIGTGAAYGLDSFSWGKSLLALLVALSLQVGVNFANDYSDGVRGTDAKRLGPTRLTASGLVPQKQVLAIALGCFGLAALAGVALIVWAGTWWMFAAGFFAIMAAWFYTGGKRPYGYMGVGASEIMVFVFFGLVATIGTTWVQAYAAPWWLWVGASGTGLASVALLLINNIRDIPTDKEVGKNTIAVRLGWRNTRIFLVLTLVSSVACGVVATRNLWASVIIVLFAAIALHPALRAKPGEKMLDALKVSGLYALVYGVAVALALL